MPSPHPFEQVKQGHLYSLCFFLLVCLSTFTWGQDPRSPQTPSRDRVGHWDRGLNPTDQVTFSFGEVDVVPVTDNDGDGFSSELDIFFDVNISSGSEEVRGQIFFRPHDDWIFLRNVDSWIINGDDTSDGVTTTIRLQTEPASTADFRIDINRVSDGELVATRVPQGDPDLGDVAVEGANTDFQSVTITSASRSLEMDIDRDGFFQGATITITASLSGGTRTVIPKLFLHLDGQDYLYQFSAPPQTLVSTNENTIAIPLMVDSTVTTDRYDATVELCDSSTPTEILARITPNLDADLDEIPLEGSSQDIITTGSLTVQVGPPSVATEGRWQIDGGSWLPSGHLVSDLETGNYTISFHDVDGWTTPDPIVATVWPDQTTSMDAFYEMETGSLVVTILPNEANGDGARWRLNGGAWRHSGERVTGLAEGSHTVVFLELDDWIAPQSRSFSITRGQDIKLQVSYEAASGSLRVNLGPDTAIGGGGAWRIASGEWYQSGALVSGLDPFTYTVDFYEVAGWDEPTPRSVRISSNQLTEFEARYTDIEPPAIFIRSPDTETHNTIFPTIDLDGVVGDNDEVVSVTWSISGTEMGNVTMTGFTTWILENVNLSAGTNTIEVTARDARGLESSDFVEVIFEDDTTSPTITITAPMIDPGTLYETHEAAMFLQGTATDNIEVEDVRWTNDRGGNGTAVGTEDWLAEAIDLFFGLNQITIEAEDTSGNKSETIVRVLYSIDPTDRDPPTIEITSHPQLEITTDQPTITIFGTGDAKQLSSGISEALVTTEFGLIVAIPSLIMHALLNRRAQGVMANMERMAVAYVNGLVRKN